MDAIVCLLQRECSHPLWLIKPHVAFSLRMVFYELMIMIGCNSYHE